MSLDTNRMARILEIDDRALDARVQAGVTKDGLNAVLRERGVFFAVDPGADATIGGMAASGASGTMTVRYGTIRENVLALEVVLADGTVIRTGSRARKSSAGYDLTHLFLGSEGTLGVITELVVRVHGLPEHAAAARVSFPDVRAAADTAIAIVQSGIPIARCELLDGPQMDAVNRFSSLDEPAVPTLFLEFHGSEAGVQEQVAHVEALARRVRRRRVPLDGQGRGALAALEGAARRLLLAARLPARLPLAHDRRLRPGVTAGRLHRGDVRRHRGQPSLPGADRRPRRGRQLPLRSAADARTTPRSGGSRPSSPPGSWRARWRWAAPAPASTASASASSAT